MVSRTPNKPNAGLRNAAPMPTPCSSRYDPNARYAPPAKQLYSCVSFSGGLAALQRGQLLPQLHPEILSIRHCVR